MQIHVVQPNETLNQIATMYGTTTNAIVTANNIPYPYKLVVGQAMVIPIVGRYYWVKQGDNLYTIAKKSGIDYQELARLNNLSLNEPLTIGMKLYIPPQPKTSAEVNGYIEPYGGVVTPNLEAFAKEAAPYLTYMAPFSFQVKRDATLKNPPLNQFAKIASDHKVVLIMVVTNLEEGKFSAELGRTILSDSTLQDKLITNIIATAKQLGFKDIHFDFEFLPPDQRENYLHFLAKAKERLAKEGFLISAALAPKTSATQKGLWYEAHDYKGIGAIVDFVVIMTYEWGYSGGPPMAVSPINEVKKVIDYAVTAMPRDKIMLGQNLYGYDWTLPFVPNGQFAKAISPQEAINIARVHNVPILYDEVAQAPHFNYTDEQAKKHEVWFEDARSIQAKFDLIKDEKLRGISYWKLGLPFPQNWLLINSNFNVVKR